VLDRPVAADRYADCRETGSFILIDPEPCDTIGMGMVESLTPTEGRGLPRHSAKLSGLIRATETHGRSIAKAISWRQRTGGRCVRYRGVWVLVGKWCPSLWLA
jgi:hypothetical protein